MKITKQLITKFFIDNEPCSSTKGVTKGATKGVTKGYSKVDRLNFVRWLDTHCIIAVNPSGLEALFERFLQDQNK